MLKESKRLILFILFLMLLFQANKCVCLKDKSPILPEQIKENISVNEAYSIIQDNRGNPNLIILDVRTDKEFQQGYIKDAINVNVSSNNFTEIIKTYDKNKTYLIYCRSGSRSRKALSIIKKLGFEKAYNFGGIIQWEAAGYAVVK